MFHKLHFLTVSYLFLPTTVFASDDFGIPKELYLAYGKSIIVGDEYSTAVKILEESGYSCMAERFAYDQLISCRSPGTNIPAFSGEDLVIEGEQVADFLLFSDYTYLKQHID